MASRNSTSGESGDQKMPEEDAGADLVDASEDQGTKSEGDPVAAPTTAKFGAWMKSAWTRSAAGVKKMGEDTKALTKKLETDTKALTKKLESETKALTKKIGEDTNALATKIKEDEGLKKFTSSVKTTYTDAMKKGGELKTSIQDSENFQKVSETMKNTNAKVTETMKNTNAKVTTSVKTGFTDAVKKGEALSESVSSKIEERKESMLTSKSGESLKLVTANCSWCTANTAHALVEQSFVSRSQYSCTACDNSTLPCKNAIKDLKETGKCGCGFARGHSDGSEDLCLVCARLLPEWSPDQLSSLDRMAYCSWCFQLGNQTFIKRAGKNMRDQYRCAGCKRGTFACSSCSDGMAQKGLPGIDLIDRQCAKCSGKVHDWLDHQSVTTTSGWCSWCYSFGKHQLESSTMMPHLMRSAYRCEGCQGITLACRTCKQGMACIGVGSSLTHLRCSRCQMGDAKWLPIVNKRKQVMGEDAAGQHADEQRRGDEAPQQSERSEVLRNMTKLSPIRKIAEEADLLRPFLLLVSMDSKGRNRIAVSLGFSLVLEDVFGDAHGEAACILFKTKFGIQERCTGSAEKIQEKSVRAIRRGSADDVAVDQEWPKLVLAGTRMGQWQGGGGGGWRAKWQPSSIATWHTTLERSKQFLENSWSKADEACSSPPAKGAAEDGAESGSHKGGAPEKEEGESEESAAAAEGAPPTSPPAPVASRASLAEQAALEAQVMSLLNFIQQQKMTLQEVKLTQRITEKLMEKLMEQDESEEPINVETVTYAIASLVTTMKLTQSTQKSKEQDESPKAKDDDGSDTSDAQEVKEVELSDEDLDQFVLLLMGKELGRETHLQREFGGNHPIMHMLKRLTATAAFKAWRSLLPPPAAACGAIAPRARSAATFLMISGISAKTFPRRGCYTFELPSPLVS
ncbi:hypothetical protein CYMTET_51967 [Cymbomonas tetramitiformis]|uniref:Uncharacterized protein n=1 Tax=Cymbomonas tetramitiformis TaxID=36881 RepID=A0AAE0BLS9_9CHLO|nr:hypothetical protein CYMTET_51967 [Cymbomonas tetramitiformis]